MTNENTPLLEMVGICKQFPGILALDNVDFRLYGGEVHSVMGQNGAGKSTLIKVLTGVHAAERGTISLEGKLIRPTSPLDAQKLGISTVYQEVNLCPNLSVAENVLIGTEGSRSWFIRWGEMRRRATAILADLNIHIDVTRLLSSYSIAVQQMTAIARALSMQARILILDEPTSSLADDEVNMLFSVIRRLKAQGMAILFITHFLDQTFKISDRITVLRNGQRVGEYPVAELSRMDLITRMVGHEISDEARNARVRRSQAPSATPEASPGSAAEAPFLTGKGLSRRGAVQDVDLTVFSGKALGLAGLLGSGRTETARLLFGIDRVESGTVTIAGEPIRIRSPLDAIFHGMGFCPEDRKSDGIIGDLSLCENIILALQCKRGTFRNLPRSRQIEIANRYIELLGIKTPNIDIPISKLSGGNQQKALLARWMATEPRMLILDEPTRGIDIAAKAEIMGEVMNLCDNGMAVLFISSELDEVLRYADQVVIMRDRRKVGEIAACDADEHAVLQIIAGGK
jgi:simple sugar transport system ATP-binding protein